MPLDELFRVLTTSRTLYRYMAPMWATRRKLIIPSEMRSCSDEFGKLKETMRHSLAAVARMRENGPIVRGQFKRKRWGVCVDGFEHRKIRDIKEAMEKLSSRMKRLQQIVILMERIKAEDEANKVKADKEARAAKQEQIQAAHS